MRDQSPDMPADLRLEMLPPLPQSDTIRALVPRIWQDEHVEAVWLGGSLAAGTGDPYSDIDLRLAVAPADLAGWEEPDLPALLGGLPLARHFVRLGEGSFLHHLIVPNGDIIDLLVQSSEVAPGIEPIVVLGCREEMFARRLASSNQTPATESTDVTAEAVRELVVNFWINSHKHRKVLHRNLDLMFPAAVYANWQMLMCMWFIAATGRAARPYHFSGIHGLTELVRAVEGAYGAEPLALCGMPARNRDEICALIERHRDVASPLGRRLAEQYGFEYPAALEDRVRRDWAAFRAGMTDSA
ncbi:MAG TPA: nucleotidyltransferase domain-containing protein [Ktedonobacterales bacterium]|nr:nucleotidyltransferase domain-containing protein [Ktedonobacterales bacterium]